VQDLNPERSVELFEAARQPLVITGLTDSWPAVQQWTPQALLQQFRDHKFKVGAAECLISTHSLTCSKRA
jgi:hypothetical protein